MSPRSSASSRSRSLNLALALGAMALVPSCAHLRGSAARDAHLESRTLAHVYAQACTPVFTHAHGVFFSQDLTLKAAPNQTLTMETDWQPTSHGSTERERYLLQGFEESKSGEVTCRIVISRSTRGSIGAVDTSRDWRMEWELLQVADPARAHTVAGEAEVRARKASRG